MKFLSSLGFVLLMTMSFSQAQIQVSKEPRHHDVFDNTWVRLLDVHIPPGDTSLMHKHSTPSVFIILSNTKSGSQALVEPEKKNFSKEGIWFEGFYTTPRIHRVWNSDTSDFHVIDMELPNKNFQTIDPPLEMKAFTLLFDEMPVRGYRLTLSAKESLQLPRRKAPVMIVGIVNPEGNVVVNNKTFINKGDYLFIKAGSEITLVNKGEKDQSFGFFELK